MKRNGYDTMTLWMAGLAALILPLGLWNLVTGSRQGFIGNIVQISLLLLAAFVAKLRANAERRNKQD